MPKQLAEIRSFNAGTVLSTDASDIPIEAASFSLNLEVGVEQGVLQGVVVGKYLLILFNGNYINACIKKK